MKRVQAALLLACLGTAPAGADPMRPLLPPAGAASSPATSPTAPSAPRREAAPAVREKEIGRLVAIREDSRGRRQALIGERWVSEGDTVEHAVVQTIDPNSVELAVGKTRTLLHLLPPLVASSEPAAATLAAQAGPDMKAPASAGPSMSRAAATGGPLPAKPPRAPLRRAGPRNTSAPEGTSP